MLPFVVLLSLLLVVLPAVDASPLHHDTPNTTLGFTARVNAKRGTTTIADADKLRAEALRVSVHKRQSGSSSSFSIANAGVSYTAQVGIGIPATECRMMNSYSYNF